MPATNTEWDRQVVATVEEFLRGDPPAPMTVQRVHLDPDRRVVIEFTADERPGCRFAYRIGIDDDEDDGDRDTPREAAVVIVSNLDEQINAADMGLPDGDPDRITWVDQFVPDSE